MNKEELLQQIMKEQGVDRKKARRILRRGQPQVDLTPKSEVISYAEANRILLTGYLNKHATRQIHKKDPKDAVFERETGK